MLYYDVNSFYPFSMTGVPKPIGQLKWYSYFKGQNSSCISINLLNLLFKGAFG